MPLTQDQEDLAQIASRFRCEHELRVDQMTVNIEKMRKEMAYENRKFVVQAIAGLSTAFAAGVAALGLLLRLLGKL